jgi:hypothetical protein
MKRYTATIRVDLVADTPEARDFLLASMVRELGEPERIVYAGGYGKPGVGVGSALSKRVALSRVRPTAKR